MRVVRTIEELREARSEWEGQVVFVPTMGFLHAGHLALMQKGRELGDHLVVSIYVNPTQFGPGEDLDAYPRDEEGDLAKCEEMGAALVFLPEDEVMYAAGETTSVQVSGLGEGLCGRSRPSHFRGVTTVVAKLFHLVQPDVAVFGQKDYQQLAIIERMVRDLHMPLEVVGVPTVREADGVALSSRNKYLDEVQRERARYLSRALAKGWRAYQGGERDAEKLVEVVEGSLGEVFSPGQVDYVECVHAEDLKPWRGDARTIDGSAVLALAVRVGRARLIDNLVLDAPLPGELHERAR